MQVDLLPVLHEAWAGGFKTQSNFAREHAAAVAVAASLGYITVRETTATFVRDWRVTPDGLRALWLMRGLR